MPRQSRRTFLKQAAAAGLASITISGTKSSGNALGANDAVRVGVAGIHGRGGDHIAELLRVKGVRITHLIDPDSKLFAMRTKSIKDRAGNEPKCFQDIRKALEDKDLDAVTIASTNHWHSLLTIWSCQAGKDVYVEKPISHNVFEGRKCVEAAEKYKRIVQHGTQQRSEGGRAAEIAGIHAGKAGKLLVSKGYICKPRWSIGTKPTGEPPKGLDFDLWLGPAAKQPYHGNLVHYNWHWFWDFGNGEIGNQGVHQADVAHWAVKGATLPTRVWSLGGRLGFKDQGQTPNMQLAIYEFGDVIVVLEVRGLVGKDENWPQKVSNEFHTSEGVVRDGKLYPKDKGAPRDIQDKAALTPGGAFGSFIRCVRERKPEAVNAPVQAAHYSAALCHLANISYRLGKTVPLSQEPEGLDNAQVAESWETIKKNLKAAGVDLSKETYTLGRMLKVDPKTEKFIDAPEADKLLTREYRAPYIVPETV